MALFKRRKYLPPAIGSALDPYHYPEDADGKPSASPSPNPPASPVPAGQSEEQVDNDETEDHPSSESG